MSSLGVFSKECDAFLDILNDLGFDDRHRKYCTGKIMSIAIRATYYIFCCRSKIGLLRNYWRFRDTFQTITFY